jgi:hypothetical protein
LKATVTEAKMFSKKTIKSFEAKYQVNENTGCWEWTASFARGGYGQFFTSVKDGREWYRAHRFSYIAHKGDIPEGMVVMHECDNPRCVNPDHLRLGTQADNVADMDAKNRGIWNRTVKMKMDVEGIKNSPKGDRELATELGCSPGHIWKIRNGKYAWMRNRADRDSL